ncbi:hypothetical protein [Geodermatophilus pulveris]|uniref:hypothetical protein n=1 Tax=Geodermatophilus pulveris TaxID=1564159 RepID=UPI0015C6507E|nr:hypothetical protein [Geodermatophilus pulveris]
MCAPGSFGQRLHPGGQQRDVAIGAGWVPAQRHRGGNIGDDPDPGGLRAAPGRAVALPDGRLRPA